ncbi:hypothetical protein DEO23_01185 [Brachybacterium endophyticum]|uniref:DUF2871 domain-containing protein n=1 Tax=Brachybacterium endophyticum TaxID=2182385 RepID=A0A2U2RQ42_9MICO|nr:DUF2871 domain-containing protein [Brachybacterium endophyticum]PWH07894.1 hypothetical protein DEO23_01185 [Brachybacterium endophyticum]
MNRLFTAVCVYLGLGLASGLAFREITKNADWPATDHTQLSVVHTHLLTLGVIVLLTVLALEVVLRLSASRGLFTWFQITYHAGVLISTGAMFARGLTTVLGVDLGGMDAGLAGIAGLGHMLLTAGFVLLMVMLRRAIVRRGEGASGQDAAARSEAARPADAEGAIASR